MLAIGYGMRGADFDPHGRDVSMYADEGGVPREDGVDHYYSALEPASLEQALDELLVRPAYCRLSAAGHGVPPDSFVVRTDRGETIPRDRTHADGWDWIDGVERRLEVFV